jgi:hypothetical protein
MIVARGVAFELGAEGMSRSPIKLKPVSHHDVAAINTGAITTLAWAVDFRRPGISLERRTLCDRWAIVQVDRDPGFGEDRLDERSVRRGVAVGDRHLAKADPVACPVEARPRGLAHLGERLGCRDEADRTVGVRAS